MKLSKKKVFTLALAVCLIAILSMSTLAWFTAEDEVTNNFYVGDSTTLDPDEVFGVDVWEEVDSDRDGNPELVGYRDTTENEADYGLILPGEVLPKAPVLENIGVHPQYARAIVTVSNAYILKDAMMGKWGDASLFLAGTPDTWTLDQILWTDDDELVYIYYYNTVLGSGVTTEPIFTDVVIPTELTLDQAIALDNFQINVLGQVIQSEHLADPDVPGTMVTTAKRAFELYWDEEGTIAGWTEDEIYGKGGEDLVIPAVDTYYTASQDEEISMTNWTATASKEVVLISEEVTNATIIIEGGDFTLTEDDAKIIRAEGGGGLVVYATAPFSINGKLVGTDMTKAEAEAYFENVLVLWYF